MSDKRPICGATRARGRGVCQSTALYPNGRCKVHGGPSPAGIASPSFKTGKHSRYLPNLPADWASRYNTQDPELVTLHHELALNVAAIEQLLASVKAKGEGTNKKPDLEVLWVKLEPLLSLQMKLVAVESRRLKEQQELVQRSEFARFAQAVLMAVATHILEPGLKAKIQADVMRLLGIAAPPLIGEIA